MGVQLECVSALGTEPATRDRRFGIAFDRNQLAIFVIHELPTADAAIGANRTSDLCSVRLRAQVARALRHRLDAIAVGSGLDLLNEWPAGEQVGEHSLPPYLQDFAGPQANLDDGI